MLNLPKDQPYAVLGLCSNVDILGLLLISEYNITCFCVENILDLIKRTSIKDDWIIHTRVKVLMPPDYMNNAIDLVIKSSHAKDVVYFREGMWELLRTYKITYNKT